MSAWGMLKQGNVIGAAERAWDWVWSKLPAPVQQFVNKVVDDEAGVVINAASTEVKALLSSGSLTLGNLVAAVPNVLKTAAASGVSVLETDGLAALSTVASYMLTQTATNAPSVTSATGS